MINITFKLGLSPQHPTLKNKIIKEQFAAITNLVGAHAPAKNNAETFLTINDFPTIKKLHALRLITIKKARWVNFPCGGYALIIKDAQTGNRLAIEFVNNLTNIYNKEKIDLIDKNKNWQDDGEFIF